MELFQNDTLGKIYLVNAYLALTKCSMENKDVIKGFLKKAKKTCSENHTLPVKRLIDSFPSHEYFFQRLPLPEIDDDLSTVIYFSKLDPSKSDITWLIDGISWQEHLSVQLPTSYKIDSKGEVSVDTFISALKKFAIQKATIGRQNQPQWYAPKRSLASIKIQNDTGNADKIKKVLGLGHINDVKHFIQISVSKDRILDLIATGDIKVRTPTFIEAKSHEYFRTWLDCDKHWGRTRHLDDIRSMGIEEVVSSPIEFELFDEIENIGKTSSTIGSYRVTQEQHLDSLIPENKTLEDIIEEIKALLEEP